MPEPHIIHTEEELIRVAKEAYYILRNLRESTVRWQNDHGVATKNIKVGWENRADEFLKNPLAADKNFHEASGIEIDKE